MSNQFKEDNIDSPTSAMEEDVILPVQNPPQTYPGDYTPRRGVREGPLKLLYSMCCDLEEKTINVIKEANSITIFDSLQPDDAMDLLKFLQSGTNQELTSITDYLSNLIKSMPPLYGDFHQTFSTLMNPRSRCAHQLINTIFKPTQAFINEHQTLLETLINELQAFVDEQNMIS